MKSGGLPYYGGKSPVKALTKWIVQQIPWEYRTLYVEPFFGMGGVLLSRARTHMEIANDANDRLVNWWNVIRDHPEEFGRALDWTHQRSRTNFEQMIGELDCADPIRRAVAFTVVVTGSIWHTDSKTIQRFRMNFSVDIGSLPSWGSEDIIRLYDRTRDLQIENKDAVEILRRIEGKETAVVYVDPPYGEEADTSPYRFAPDREALRDTLAKQRGRVAISGYGDDWDCLGWRSTSFESMVRVYSAASMKAKPRIEKLWMNYDPPGGLFHDGGKHE